MIWELKMRPGRIYNEPINWPLVITRISLDVNSCTDEPVQVVLLKMAQELVLCTLFRTNGLHTVTMDIEFEKAKDVSFFLRGGPGIVKMSGFLEIPELEVPGNPGTATSSQHDMDNPSTSDLSHPYKRFKGSPQDHGDNCDDDDDDDDDDNEEDDSSD